MGDPPISFQKKIGNRIPYIPGTKPSIQNAQLLTSLGVPSFDAVVGGGIPVGTVILIEEDTYGTFARLLIKYFLAEGVVSGHALLCASQDIDPEHLIQELPSPIESDHSFCSGGGPEEKMTIAWRYQNLRSVQSSPGGLQLGHHFDLTRIMPPDMLKDVSITSWNGPAEGNNNMIGIFRNPLYAELLEYVRNKINAGQFDFSAIPDKRNLLRVAIHSIGSPLWDPTSGEDLLLFFYSLRALMRSSYAVCMVSVPSHILEDMPMLKKCIHLCDTAVKLESFSGSDKETNPVFRDYHGLFHINKLSAINTLACHVPDSFDLAFKLRRRKFVIEKLHLPPELQETTQREQDEIRVSAMGCGAPQKQLLEF
ncbi:elongator complex protein 4 [Anabrus simplex]|uniref:elongator complex protein 4 n=1 Tax=Anabrus simplex TaxID=316456 RepID=UPI0034DD47F5